MFDDGLPFHGQDADRGRRLRQPERGLRPARALARGRRLQVRHHQVGNGCSIGSGAFVHYGVTMGDNVVLDADSFLMKGEILDSNTGWCGNPAKLVRRHVVGRDLQKMACRLRDRSETGASLPAHRLMRLGLCMRNRVTLRDVTAGNWEAVAELYIVPTRKT